MLREHKDHRKVYTTHGAYCDISCPTATWLLVFQLREKYILFETWTIKTCSILLTCF